jgi:hypothetical protein
MLACGPVSGTSAGAQARPREPRPDYLLEPWSSRSATAVILHADIDTEAFSPRVAFFLDGARAGECASNPYYLPLDLERLDPGTHHFHAEAFRGDARIATSPDAAFHIGPLQIVPDRAAVPGGAEIQFKLLDMDGLPAEGDWSVEGGTYPGTITKGGLYTAPMEPGTFQVIAGNPFDTRSRAVAQVTVTEPPPGLRDARPAQADPPDDPPPALDGPVLELDLKAGRLAVATFRPPGWARPPFTLARRRIAAGRPGAEPPLVREVSGQRLIDDVALEPGAAYRYSLRDASGRELGAALVRVASDSVVLRWDLPHPPSRVALLDKDKKELRSVPFRREAVFSRLRPSATYFLALKRPSGPDLRLGFQTLPDRPFLYASTVSAAPGSRIRFHACNPNPAKPVVIRIAALNPGSSAQGRLLADSGPLTVKQASVPYDGAVFGFDWPEAFAWDVPADLPSGLCYASIGYPESTVRFRIPIVIEPGPASPSQVLVLANTFTWQAYNTFGGLGYYKRPIEFPFQRTAPLFGRPAPMPEISFRRPILGADPLNYMTHTAGGERFLLDWLDRNRVGYDLVPDQRLSVLDPEEALKRYRVLVIQVHPEYLTSEEVGFIQGFLGRGGNVLILAGNSLFCQVALQGSPERMARLVRRTDINRVQALIGEYYRGWSKFMNDYLVTRPDHWAFQGLGARPGSHLARGGPWGGGNGWEMDTPGPYSPPGMDVLALGDRTIRDIPTPAIVAYTHPAGGTLVNVGSIVFTSTLKSDPMAAGFVRNCLVKFGVNVPGE